MDEIEISTNGFWRPSPGSVYPVLEQLTNEGLAKKREDGKYELTPKGQTEIQDWPPFGPRRKRAQSVEDMLMEMNSFVSYFEELKSSPESSNRKKILEQREKLMALIDRMSKLT